MSVVAPLHLPGRRRIYGTLDGGGVYVTPHEDHVILAVATKAGQTTSIRLEITELDDVADALDDIAEFLAVAVVTRQQARNADV